MICDLEDISNNLHTLISQFSQLHNRLVNPIEAKKSNFNNSILVKMPKVIFLVKIAPYLTPNQITTISSVCSALRRAIYSPLGFKILSYVHTPYPIQIRYIESQSEEKQKPNFDMMNYNLPNEEDQKMLKKARAQCKLQLMNTYSKYSNRLEQFQELQRRLKSEKIQVKKLKMQAKFHSDIKKEYSIKNIDYKNQLKITNQGFDAKIKKMDRQYEEMIQERSRLQNQKQALVGKIREYQGQIDSIKSDSENSKQVLKKIKNYLLYKQL